MLRRFANKTRYNWHIVLFIAALVTTILLSYWLFSATDDPAWHTRLTTIPPVVGTLLGPFFGLVALMLGALYNAKLNRDRDERLREEDARSLAAALLAEIQQGLATIRMIDAMAGQKFDPELIRNFFSEMNHQPIFEANLERLGLLGQDLSREVVRFAEGRVLETWLQQNRDDSEFHKQSNNAYSPDPLIEIGEALAIRLDKRANGLPDLVRSAG